jgi:predicted nuclease of predicted toxin-antitoxin system
MIGFYMDENVKGAIIRGLRQRSVDVLTAQEDGFDHTPDPEVMDRATEPGRVLFSQDTDMLIIAAQRQAEGISFSGVIYAQQNTIPISRCIEDLELIAYCETLETYQNVVQYLPL